MKKLILGFVFLSIGNVVAMSVVAKEEKASAIVAKNSESKQFDKIAINTSTVECIYRSIELLINSTDMWDTIQSNHDKGSLESLGKRIAQQYPDLADTCDKEGRNALDYAVMQENINAVYVLQGTGLKVDSRLASQLKVLLATDWASLLGDEKE